MNPTPAKRRRVLATAASVGTTEELAGRRLASVVDTEARSIVLAQGKTTVGQHQAATTAALRRIAEERGRFSAVSSRASAVVGGCLSRCLTVWLLLRPQSTIMYMYITCTYTCTKKTLHVAPRKH